MTVNTGDLSRRYRDRSVFGPFTPVRPGDVEALENAIGRPLPPEYRAYLEAANGGTLPYAVRVPPGHDDAGILGFTEMHPLGGLLRAHRALPGTVFAEALAGDEVLPVARDGGGSTLFLDLSHNRFGQVLCFAFGLPQWTGADRRSAVAEVLADDFHAYLDSLFVDEDTAEWAWEYYVGTGPDDPWRPVVEAWLDEGLPGWRTRPWAKP